MTFPVSVPDVQIYAGDTYEQSYTFKDADGDPINLVTAGYTEWLAQYRCCRDCSDYISFTVNHSNASTGVIHVSLTHEETVKIKKAGYWDLKAKHGTKLKTFIASRVEVLEAVTRV